MFVAYDVSIELIRELRTIVPKVRVHDANMADQMRRAATSVALNLGEGRRRVGKDRIHMFRIAEGSAAEIESALDASAAWGYIDETRARPVVSRLLRLLWGLTHS